ncbi:MAG: hypothetical protein ACNA8W_23695, partial [Bradymonadaceae bacterium]
MRNITRQSLWALSKLGLCGASIAAIAWGVISFYPSSTMVKESEADIVSLVTFARSSTQKFASTLDALGHDAPRSYDYNGNKVFFSSKTTTQDPMEVLHEYQRVFTQRGINERPYLEAIEDGYLGDVDTAEDFARLIEERGLAMLSGQLVPSVITENHISMGGGLIEGEPTTCAEASKILEKKADEGVTDFEDLFRGFRSIDATRSEDGQRTFVTASWSDGDLDMRKHQPDHHEPVLDANPDPLVPSCPGCTRLTRFAGERAEEQYVSNIFKSPQHHSSVLEFYLKAMESRGWR